MLEELDKHSRFHDPAENKDIKDDTEGSFAGIGVTLDLKMKTLKIDRVFPDGPADKAGILPGDIIMTVDGVNITEKNFTQARKLIKGEPNSEVILGVKRGEPEDLLKIKVIRDTVVVPSVTRARMLKNPGLGYIHVRQFTRTTAGDFQKALEYLEEKGLKGLVIDLRGNPGGMLTTAVEMCSFFLDKGDLVIYTQGRKEKERQDYKAIGGSKFDIPLAILVDKGSASASEILSACLRDYKKAVLIGEKTYGKGSVQTIVDLRDGSSIRFTIAKYYTKSGTTIHGVGITPHVSVTISDESHRDLSKHLNSLLPKEEEFDDFDDKDDQLQAAAGLLEELIKDESNEQLLDKFIKDKSKFLKKYSRTEVKKD
jgi:carboxyl-terminal processing protease